MIRSRPSPATRTETRRRDRARCVLVDGIVTATHLSADQHGTQHAYDYWGCRCRRCKAANAGRAVGRAAARRRSLAQRVRVGGLLVATHLPPEAHGTANAVDYHGCQCVPCTANELLRREARAAEHSQRAPRRPFNAALAREYEERSPNRHRRRH